MTNDSTKIKYYTYLRKSSESEERQIQSIERQADEVQKLIAQQHLNVVAVFQESRSAMTPNNRPEFSKMIKGIKAGKANGIICWHMSRLARNPLESGIVQQLLEDEKIKRIITKDREYTSADNAIIFSVESSLATQFSKDLGKMVKSGMEKKVSMGLAPIKAPIGYLNTKSAEHGNNSIIKDPERFLIIRQIWDLMLTGKYNPSAILAIISREGKLKPYNTKGTSFGNLSYSGIYKILTNPFYTGLFVFKGKIYQGKHEPMITLTEFETVQDLLGRKDKERPSKHIFPYTGLFKCSGCNSSITATKKHKLIKSTGLYKSFTYYYCCDKRPGIKCASKKILTDKELEEQILVEIGKVAIDDNFYKLAQKIIKENSSHLQEQARVIANRKDQEIESLEKELRNLLQLRIADAISNEEFQTEKQIRENKLVWLREQQKQEINNPFLMWQNIEERFAKTHNIKERFISADAQGKKKILIDLFGSNSQLNGEKLCIYKPNWLKTLTESKEYVLSEIAWFELEKYVEVSARNTYFSDMCPRMLAVVKEVGTELK